jgi:hypothetical protein
MDRRSSIFAEQNSLKILKISFSTADAFFLSYLIPVRHQALKTTGS